MFADKCTEKYESQISCIHPRAGDAVLTSVITKNRHFVETLKVMHDQQITCCFVDSI